MQTNTVQVLVDYIKDLTGQTNASDAKIIRAMNFGADHYSYLKASARGKWDSRNHTDLARKTATLTTSGKVDMEDETVTIQHFEYLDDEGSYQTVDTIDQRDYLKPLDTLYSTPGAPKYYEMIGRTLRVHPTPDASYTVRLTSGRAHPRFSTDKLTAEVGVEPIQEEYIALYASDRIMIGTNDPSRTQVRNELVEKQKEVREMITLRDQDTPKRIKSKVDSTFKRNF